MREGLFEAGEARARTVIAAREGIRGRDRRPFTIWWGRYYAIVAAIAHGRGPTVRAELDTLIGELGQLPGAQRDLPLNARANRAWLLIDDGRPMEAEAEARAILRALTRIQHLCDVQHLELRALHLLGDALCVHDQHDEAEKIARWHLPRADGQMATALHRLLMRSLSGQGRHEEALAESCKSSPDPLPWASGELELATAAALHGLGQHEEAKEEALRALAACERYLHPEADPLGNHLQLARAARTAATGDVFASPPISSSSRVSSVVTISGSGMVVASTWVVCSSQSRSHASSRRSHPGVLAQPVRQPRRHRRRPPRRRPPVIRTCDGS
ncbi:hypothetical protein ABT024_21340 [Streptomyces sp. NPDC002812]|uniref:hypothetical protein n=1 Tax=Streptomyces sp. NPDC002812 TaxID=3154434 RepID=UPI003326E57B